MTWVRIRYTVLLALILAAFGLRLLYLRTSHPFFDEFTTILAAEAIRQHGLPRLPSGLVYEHGLLFTYLDALAIGLFAGLGGVQPGPVLETVARWPSVWLSALTAPALYRVGRRWFNPWIGLLAAGLFALSPEGMVWGARARMYALATLLALLTVYLVFEGSVGRGRARYRWLALLALLATLLTQFGAMILVGPLLAAGLIVGWRTRPPGARPWFARWPVLLSEGLGLAVVLFSAALVKRWGQPLGASPLGSDGAGPLLGQVLSAVTYQTGLVLQPGEALDFLARQFGVTHHLGLVLVAGLGAAVWLARSAAKTARPPAQRPAYLFTLLVFGLIIVEMITLLPPWRRNPRYIVMFLPLFYLLVGAGLFQLAPQRLIPAVRRPRVAAPVALSALVILAGLGYPDWQVAYRTPEPAYEVAFRYIQERWQPGDAVMTMNVAAAALYLGDRLEPDALYFPMQEDAGQFLVTGRSGPVDRWLGARWLGQVAAFNQALNRHPRAWFVTDTIRLPVYYRGSWLAALDSQMERALETDEVIVYLTRPDRTPVPAGPDFPVAADLGGLVRLDGYSLQPEPAAAAELAAAASPAGRASPAGLRVTLFWTALAEIPVDYTVFLHLRDPGGTSVAQHDGQPLAGAYPTSRWRPGETVADAVLLDVAHVPPGRYTLYAGLYDLASGQRLPVADDASGENAIMLGEVTLP